MHIDHEGSNQQFLASGSWSKISSKFAEWKVFELNRCLLGLILEELFDADGRLVASIGLS